VRVKLFFSDFADICVSEICKKNDNSCLTFGSEPEHASILAMAGSPMRPPEGGFVPECCNLPFFAMEICAIVGKTQ
jgi:hypothetical protein